MSDTLQHLLQSETITWNAVVARLASHPLEASPTIRMGWGRTPLHYALFLLEREHDIPLTLTVVKAFIEASRDAVFIVDSGGYTPLHFGASAEVVQALLEAYPGAASVRDNRGRIPLHRANNADVVNLLVEAYPEGVGAMNNCGQLPLHYAAGMRGEKETSPSVLQPLLNAGMSQNVGGIDGGGGVFKKDHQGKTPFEVACSRLLDTLNSPWIVEEKNEDLFNLLWDKVYILARWAKRNDNANVDVDTALLPMRVLFKKDHQGKTPLKAACDRLLGELNSREEEEEGNEDLVHLLWERVYILARLASIAFANRNENANVHEDAPLLPVLALAKRNDNANVDEDAPLLHMLVVAKCPQPVILRSLSDYPLETSARDSQGRTPLSIAASQNDVSPEIIQALLDTDHFDSRIARMANNEKRVPFHLAAESGYDFEEIIEKILLAAPEALETRDVQTRMYPFMLAAEGDHSNLNTVFQLLRAKPEMARGMAEGVHWENSKLKVQCENTELKLVVAAQATTIAEQATTNAELEAENAEQATTIAEQATTNAELEAKNSEQATTIAEQATMIAKLRETISEQRTSEQTEQSRKRKLGEE